MVPAVTRTYGRIRDPGVILNIVMPDMPETNDPESWHRYFAMEYNNRAWDLSVRARTAGEDLEMLDAAHASALHWNAIGTELNRMRAMMLLAEVHALLGLAESATAYAEQMRSYFLEHDTPDWEIAFTHAIHAHAACVAGDIAIHRDSHSKALLALGAIADDEDRRIVQQTFDQVPPP